MRGRMSTVQYSEVSDIDRVHRNIIGTNINTTDCFDVMELKCIAVRKGSRIHL